jgi:hypothetical protein
MIAGAELTAWLSDRDRQKISHDARKAFAQKWAGKPLMTDIQHELDAMPVHSSAGVRAVAERFLARHEELEILVDEMIAASAADPFFTPPFLSVSSDIHTGLLLFEHPSLSIAMGVTGVDALAAKKSGKRGPTSIGFTGYLTLFQFLKAGGATLSFWEAPQVEAGFVREGSGRCRLVGRRKVEDGESFVMDGRLESFVIDHAASDVLYLQAIVRVDAAPLSVEYDSGSFEFVGASSTDEGSSRIQMMTTLLRLMERTDAAPVIAEALASPHFYTRWHIMRELLALDAELALPHLRAMAEADPHPEVRATAKQTLDAFFGDGGAASGGNVQCRA